MCLQLFSLCCRRTYWRNWRYRDGIEDVDGNRLQNRCATKLSLAGSAGRLHIALLELPGLNLCNSQDSQETGDARRGCATRASWKPGGTQETHVSRAAACAAALHAGLDLCLAMGPAQPAGLRAGTGSRQGLLPGRGPCTNGPAVHRRRSTVPLILGIVFLTAGVLGVGAWGIQAGIHNTDGAVGDFFSIVDGFQTDVSAPALPCRSWVAYLVVASTPSARLASTAQLCWPSGAPPRPRHLTCT